MQTFVTHLFGLSIFSFIMCFIFLAGKSSIVVPISLAFSTMGILSVFTAAGLKRVNKRLDEVYDQSSGTSMSKSKTQAEQ